jgi:hypothetical protein
VIPIAIIGGPLDGLLYHVSRERMGVGLVFAEEESTEDGPRFREVRYRMVPVLRAGDPRGHVLAGFAVHPDSEWFADGRIRDRLINLVGGKTSE